MPSTLTISGPTFTNYVAKALPTIPALQTLCFFGTGGDGINTNRASGPAISVMSGAPVYSTNFVSLGLQSGRQDVLETNNPRTAGVLASGWTWAAVTRITSGPTVNACALSDLNGTSVGATLSMTLRNATPSLAYMYQNAIRGTLTAVSTYNNWHFIALTYTGGAAGTYSVYDFTDQPTTGMPVSYTIGAWATGVQSPHFGNTASDFGQGPIDMAFGMVAFSPLSAGALSALAASVRSWVGLRGIVC